MWYITSKRPWSWPSLRWYMGNETFYVGHQWGGYHKIKCLKMSEWKKKPPIFRDVFNLISWIVMLGQGWWQKGASNGSALNW